MPDLSTFPTYISIPLILIFAGLVIISRFLDVSEKWAKWSERRAAKRTGETAEKARSQPVAARRKPIEPHAAMAANRVLIYAFLGGILLPTIYSAILYIAAPHPELRYHHIVTLLSAMVYAAVAAFFALYLRRRSTLIDYSKITTMVSGLVLSQLVALPFNIGMTIIAYQRIG